MNDFKRIQTPMVLGDKLLPVARRNTLSQLPRLGEARLTGFFPLTEPADVMTNHKAFRPLQTDPGVPLTIHQLLDRKNEMHTGVLMPEAGFSDRREMLGHVGISTSELSEAYQQGARE